MSKPSASTQIIQDLSTASGSHPEPTQFSKEDWEELKDKTWIATYTGRAFHAWHPTPEEVTIQDIAHHLSLINRYNGSTRFPLSVAQHSLMVMERAPQEHKLTALLHDAAEAYVMDVPRPWKPFIQGYRELEDTVMAVIAKKFKLTWPLPQVIKTIDAKMLHTEASQLLPGAEWVDYSQVYRGMPIKEMDWRSVEQIFLQVFSELVR